MQILINAVIIATLVIVSTSAFSDDFKVNVTDLESVTESTHDKRSSKSSTTINANSKKRTTDKTGNAEERAMNAATNDMIEDIIMRMAYQHWFEGGKTKADVRLIMGLPAKGDAVDYANWGKYLKYLAFLEEKKVQAANAAMVEAIKWRLTYKGWYLDGKTFKQVREILGLPPKGEAPNLANWEKFVDYVKFVKEYSQQFS